MPGGASSEASFVVKVLRVFLFDIISRTGAETLKLPRLSGERSQAARPEERGGGPAVRV